MTGASNNHNDSFLLVFSFSSFCALHRFRRARSALSCYLPSLVLFPMPSLLWVLPILCVHEGIGWRGSMLLWGGGSGGGGGQGSTVAEIRGFWGLNEGAFGVNKATVLQPQDPLKFSHTIGVYVQTGCPLVHSYDLLLSAVFPALAMNAMNGGDGGFCRFSCTVCCCQGVRPHDLWLIPISLTPLREVVY